MRIGIAQLNPTVGDLTGNLALALDAYEQLVGQGVDLIVYPELMLCGYPPRDLLLKENFGKDCRNALEEFARTTGPTPALIGFPEQNDGPSGEPFFNAAAWCVAGSVGQTFRKRLLPTYDVFDEDRYFSPGDASPLIELKGKRIAVTICEDAWNSGATFIHPIPSTQSRRKSPTCWSISLPALGTRARNPNASTCSGRLPAKPGARSPTSMRWAETTSLSSTVSPSRWMPGQRPGAIPILPGGH